MKLGDKFTKTVSALIVWCMLSTSLLALLIVAVPTVTTADTATVVGDRVVANGETLTFTGTATLGYNLTVRSGGAAVIRDCDFQVAQNYDPDFGYPSSNLFYTITVEDGGALTIINSTIHNQLITQNQAAPGLGIFVRNNGDMLVENSVLSFPGHFVVDNAHLEMWNSVVCGEDITNVNPQYFPTEYFNDAPVMMFMSSEIELYNTSLLNTFQLDGDWLNYADLYNYNYAFASDDANRNAVTYTFQRTAEGASNYSMEDLQFYKVNNGLSLVTTGFDIAGMAFSAADVDTITLNVQYTTPYPFSDGGTPNAFTYTLPFGTPIATTITATNTYDPANTSSNMEVVKSYVLPDMSATNLAQTIVSFTNTKASPVYVNRIWVDIALSYDTYKNITLAGDTTLLAVDSVLNVNSYNFTDPVNFTTNKLAVLEGATAYLYGTTLDQDDSSPGPFSVSPILPTNKTVVINIIGQNTVWDTTVGESLPELLANDTTFYSVIDGEILNVNAFNVGDLSGNLVSAKLWVSYRTDVGYTGTDYIQWNLPGSSVKYNAIPITNRNGVNRDLSYDLFANGIDTLSEIATLNISYQNTGAQIANIDRLWIEVVLSPSTYIYRWSSFNVTDVQNIPVDGAVIDLTDNFAGNKAVYYSPSGVGFVPPVEVLDYLGVDASTFNVTNPFGMATIPVLTDIVTPESLPRSMDAYGYRTNMGYDALVTYVNASAVEYQNSSAVTFEQYPEMADQIVNINMIMTGLYLDKPDLIVGDLIYSPNPLYEETAGATITVTLSNDGITAAQTVLVRFIDTYANKVIYLGNITENLLLPGESRQIVVDMINTSVGTHEITVIVDPDNVVTESDEGNNVILSYPLVALKLLPDLTVSNSQMAFSMTPAMTNLPLTINATVNNIGFARAANATVSFYLGNPTSGGIFIGSSIVNVTAGGQTNATLVWTPTVVGKYTLYAKISGVEEYSYVNNLAYKNIQIFVSEVGGPLRVNDTIGTMWVNDTHNMLKNVIVEESGILILNAKMYFYQAQNNEFWVVVRDSGQIIMNGEGSIQSNYNLAVYMAESSNLTIEDATAITSNKVTVIFDDNSSAYIAGSEISYEIIAPATSYADIVAYDTNFAKAWATFAGNATAELTSITIPSLTVSDNAVVYHYRWITVTTYDETGVIKLSGVYVQLNEWNDATPVKYASGVSDANAHVKFRALCDVLGAAPGAYYGNYKMNGTYWHDGIRTDTVEDVEVSLTYFTSPLRREDPTPQMILPVLMSDVAIYQADVSFSPTNPVTNSTATIVATVRNIGSQVAENVNVTFLLNTTGQEKFIASRIITAIDSGASFTVNVPWSPNLPGTAVITIVLDDAMLLNETTRGNNQVSVSVLVLDVPHLYTSEINFYAGTGTTKISEANVGALIRIVAKVVNDGESTAANFVVSFWLDSPVNGDMIGSTTILGLEAGTNTTVSQYWTADVVSGNGIYQNRSVYVSFDRYVFTTDSVAHQVLLVIDNRADLVVDDAIVIKGTESVTQASPGESVKISFNVTNDGMMPASDAEVLINLTSGQHNYKITNFTIDVNTGSTIWLNKTWILSGVDLGEYVLNIWVNPEGVFDETNLTNNHFMMDFTVATLVNPIIQINTPGGKTNWQPGDTIFVSGYVQSADHVPLENTTIQIYLADSQGFLIGDKQTRTTDSEGNFYVNLAVPQYENEDAYITVSIDNGGQPVTGQMHITISSGAGTELPWWLIVLIIVVVLVVIIVFSLYLYKVGLGKMVECGECGALIPDSSKRCPKCGTVFEINTAKCSECGAWIPADSTECPECHAVFMTGPKPAEEGDAYMAAMKDQYEQYIDTYREQAKAALGAKYSEEKFQEWLKTEPGFLTFDDWLKKKEEDKKSSSYTCPSCGTLNPRTATICHKCGTVFENYPREQAAEAEKPRTFRKIVKRAPEKKVKKEEPGEGEQKPPEGQQ